jgi:DNA-binding SARP family transcriptional activator
VRDRCSTWTRSNLGMRPTLFGLRQVVEPVRPACLCVEGATIALKADAVDVDAMSFERMVTEGTPETLGQAVELYRGDLLDGLTLQEPPFEEWLMGERERLRELAIEAHAALIAAQRAAGAVEAALQTGLRLIALDPLQEPVHRTLMRLYAQLGRRPSALHQYQLCVSVLQRELGVEPEEETKQLYREILRRRAVITEATPLATSRSSPPVARVPPLTLATDTPLIGRDQEMAQLRVALAEAVPGAGQVVLIVGEAGVGKTRLVAELAADIPKVNGRVLIGRGHETEQILPFGPWVDALGMGQVLVDETWLATLPGIVRRELGRLLPELGPGDSEPAAPSRLSEALRGGSPPPRACRVPATRAPDPGRPPLGRRDEHPAAGVHRTPLPSVAAPSAGDGARGGGGRCADASADARRAGARAPRRHDGAPAPVAG